MKTLRRLQRGFVAIIAIVVLVLFALLGIYISTQMTSAALSTSASFLSIQAWFAARSGMNWGVHKALHGSACAATTTFAIGDFSVTVNCTATAVTEGPDSYTVNNLTATAVKGSPGDVIYVSRKVASSVTLGP